MLIHCWFTYYIVKQFIAIVIRKCLACHLASISIPGVCDALYRRLNKVFKPSPESIFHTKYHILKWKLWYETNALRLSSLLFSCRLINTISFQPVCYITLPYIFILLWLKLDLTQVYAPVWQWLGYCDVECMWNNKIDMSDHETSYLYSVSSSESWSDIDFFYFSQYNNILDTTARANFFDIWNGKLLNKVSLAKTRIWSI